MTENSIDIINVEELYEASVGANQGQTARGVGII